MALSYNLAYQEIISVHYTRCQIFAGKTDSTFWNIWQWVILNSPLQTFCAEMCKIFVIAFSWESLQFTCYFLYKIGEEGGRFSLERYLCVFQRVEVVVSVWGPTGPGWLVPISMWFIATKEHHVGDGCHDEIDKHGEKIRLWDDNFLKPLAEG